MAVYEYKGLTEEGRDVTGIIDAENPRTARLKLRGVGIYPVEVKEGGEARLDRQAPAHGFGLGSRFLLLRRVRTQDVAVMTRQLATLLSAGLPLVEALSALVEQIEREGLKKIVAEVRERVKEGKPLAEALRTHPEAFSEMYINMVSAGEASGTLSQVLVRLSDFLEYQMRLKNHILATMTYPIFMAVVGTGILFSLMTYVVPKVTRVFEEMHHALPAPTLLLLGMSHLFQRYWWVAAALLLGAVALVRRGRATPEGRMRWDTVLLSLPLFGRLIKMIALARFARTLSTLLNSGIPLLPSLDIVKAVIANKAIEAAVEEARESLREGKGLAHPLKKSGLFPPLVTHMMAVGERSGEMEAMLLKVSEAYENEVATEVVRLTSLLGPVMILIMGAVVLFIVLAILLPLFEMSQLVR